MFANRFGSAPATSADNIEHVTLPTRAALPASYSADPFGDTISEDIAVQPVQRSSNPALLPAPATHQERYGHPKYVTNIIVIYAIDMSLGLAWAIAAVIIWMNGGFGGK
jgi:hypothetical protein